METRSLLLECFADAARAVFRGIVWGLGVVCLVALLFPLSVRAQVAGPPAVDGASWLEDYAAGAIPYTVDLPTGGASDWFTAFLCVDGGTLGCIDLGQATGVLELAWLPNVFGSEVTDYASALWLVETTAPEPEPEEPPSASEVALGTLAAAQAAASSAEVSASAAVEVAQLAGVLFWCFCTGLGFFGYSVGSKDV